MLDKEERITDKKVLSECRDRFYLEVKKRPELDSMKQQYQYETHSVYNKNFEDFDWFFLPEYDVIIRKKKEGS